MRLLPAVVAFLLLAPAAGASAAAHTRYGELLLTAPAAGGLHVLPAQRAPFSVRPRGRALGGAARRGRGGAHARRVWRVVSLGQIGGRRRRARQPRRACLDAGQPAGPGARRAAPGVSTSRSWRRIAARCAAVRAPGRGAGSAVDRLAGRAGARTSRCAGRPPRYADTVQHGLRASHRHAERLRARRRAGDHPLDLHLPRALERLERHWLQLPRRRLRARLRGPRRAASTARSSARTRRASIPAASASQ